MAKAMNKQMEMFQDGGLEQDGGTIDPVSGNDVPVGSSQEEVRDDIPAQLSEGEFVFPADVVRFIGLFFTRGLTTLVGWLTISLPPCFKKAFMSSLTATIYCIP